MFKLIVVVFAALLALAVAAPKPAVVSYGAYGSPYVAAAPAVAYSGYAAAAPVAYSSYAAPSVYASPLAYSGYAASPLSYY